jgi:hypothetical protein
MQGRDKICNGSYRLPLLSTLSWLLENQVFSGTALSKTTSPIRINADKYLLRKLPTRII